ncbi:hypothetical protein BDZ89DRAFT_1163070 [Hymenopellis radicata]|nr:hypothetical protein BDZ89DRAFT_1163070 [Hymenopellis radicata]
MGLHFYDSSPSGPKEQRGRLGPPLSLLNAGIPCVVWAEDALSIAHRVPTNLFDQQLLVPDALVDNAANAICTDLSYSVTPIREDDRRTWVDMRGFNKDEPHAFDLPSTVFLQHADPQSAYEEEKPLRIFIHGASTFHFDLDDSSRTTLNPEPPGQEYANIRFPTLQAFYDNLVEMLHEPPHPFRHMKLNLRLKCWMSYLSLYTLPGKGITDMEDEETNERVLIPEVLPVLEQVKVENRPMIIRELLPTVTPLHYAESVMERRTLKKERLKRMGKQYHPPAHVAFSPLDRDRGLPPPAPQPPRLTPFLTRNGRGDLWVQWRPLAQYMSMVKRMTR